MVEAPPHSVVENGSFISNFMWVGDSCGRYKNNPSKYFPFENVLFEGISSEFSPHLENSPHFLCENFDIIFSFQFPVKTKKIVFHFKETEEKKKNVDLVPTLLFETSESSWKYSGCYRDIATENRELPKFMGTELTHKLCQKICKGYSAAAIQFRSECWCGNNFGKFGENSSLCSPCPEERLPCGNRLSNSIFSRKMVSPKIEQTGIRNGTLLISMDTRSLNSFDFLPIHINLNEKIHDQGIILQKVTFEDLEFDQST